MLTFSAIEIGLKQIQGKWMDEYVGINWSLFDLACASTWVYFFLLILPRKSQVWICCGLKRKLLVSWEQKYGKCDRPPFDQLHTGIPISWLYCQCNSFVNAFYGIQINAALFLRNQSSEEILSNLGTTSKLQFCTLLHFSRLFGR